MTKEQEMNEEALDTMMETLDETEDSSLDEESFMPEPKEDEKTALPKRSVRPLSETGGLGFQQLLSTLELDPVLKQLPREEVDLIPEELLCRVCPYATWVKYKKEGQMNLACICASGGGMDKQITFDLMAPKDLELMNVVACGDLIRRLIERMGK